MDQFDRLPYLFVGWLMGLLAPAIVDRIRRNYRASALRKAIIADLHELQFTMASVAFTLRDHLASMSDDWLDWIEPIIRNYAGPEVNARMAKGLAELRKIPADGRGHLLLMNRKPMVGLSLKEYGIPLLAGNIGEVSILPIPFQVAVLRIKGHLDLFNQDVVLLRKHFDRTFDSSLSKENRRAEDNLEQGYEDLAKKARGIAERISKLQLPA
jgi:hypothetical protein